MNNATTASDVDGSKVSVGDTVVCVDADASFTRLAVGAEYVAQAAYDGSPTVIVGLAYHSMDRFRKVVR